MRKETNPNLYTIQWSSKLIVEDKGIVIIHIFAFRNLQEQFYYSTRNIFEQSRRKERKLTFWRTRTFPHARDCKVLLSSLSSIPVDSFISWKQRFCASLNSINTTVCVTEHTWYYTLKAKRRNLYSGYNCNNYKTNLKQRNCEFLFTLREICFKNTMT